MTKGLLLDIFLERVKKRKKKVDQRLQNLVAQELSNLLLALGYHSLGLRRF